MQSNIFRVAALAALLALGGCATPSSKPLYHWGAYQAQVYEHFKGEGSPEQQLTVLEEGVQQARAKGAALPPGYHAHLGLLYAKVGKDDQVLQQLQTEKSLFPEASAYVDFLLQKFKKK